MNPKLPDLGPVGESLHPVDPILIWASGLGINEDPFGFVPLAMGDEGVKKIVGHREPIILISPLLAFPRP